MAMNIKDFMAETIVAVLHRDSLSVCVTFTIINDDIVEKDEMFLVNITIPFHQPDNLMSIVIITDEDDSEFSLKVHLLVELFCYSCRVKHQVHRLSVS